MRIHQIYSDSDRAIYKRHRAGERIVPLYFEVDAKNKSTGREFKTLPQVHVYLRSVGKWK